MKTQTQTHTSVLSTHPAVNAASFQWDEYYRYILSESFPISTMTIQPFNCLMFSYHACNEDEGWSAPFSRYPKENHKPMYLQTWYHVLSCNSSTRLPPGAKILNLLYFCFILKPSGTQNVLAVVYSQDEVEMKDSYHQTYLSNTFPQYGTFSFTKCLGLTEL